MPWTPDQAKQHNKKLNSSERAKWASIANSILRERGNEGMAIRVANAKVRSAAQRRLNKAERKER